MVVVVRKLTLLLWHLGSDLFVKPIATTRGSIEIRQRFRIYVALQELMLAGQLLLMERRGFKGMHLLHFHNPMNLI